MTASRARIVLASTSSARIALLEQAGIEFTARGAPIDERLVEAPLIEAKVKPLDIAAALAAAKATAVGATDPSALTIGADQVLESEGRRWTKPAALPQIGEDIIGVDFEHQRRPGYISPKSKVEEIVHHSHQAQVRH